jgi:hypothetical protein
MVEKVANSIFTNPLFGTCCHKGKISLPLFQKPPHALEQLFDGIDVVVKEFCNNIIQYNNAFIFTSLRVNQNRTLGPGPYCFNVHGRLTHKCNVLLPEPNI